MAKKNIIKASLLALAALQFAIVSNAVAADHSVSPGKRAAVHVFHHERLRVVRDYDGTPVMFRNNVAIPVPSAQPTRYLNGELVRPTGYAR